jgi:hypothetical protein
LTDHAISLALLVSLALTLLLAVRVIPFGDQNGAENVTRREPLDGLRQPQRGRGDGNRKQAVRPLPPAPTSSLPARVGVQESDRLPFL